MRAELQMPLLIAARLCIESSIRASVLTMTDMRHSTKAISASERTAKPVGSAKALSSWETMNEAIVLTGTVDIGGQVAQRIAAHHQHGHRLSHRATNGEDAGADQHCPQPRHDHEPDGLEPGRAQCRRRFPQRVGWRTIASRSVTVISGTIISESTRPAVRRP